jgi:hypothetical protein
VVVGLECDFLQTGEVRVGLLDSLAVGVALLRAIDAAETDGVVSYFEQAEGNFFV